MPLAGPSGPQVRHQGMCARRLLTVVGFVDAALDGRRLGVLHP